MDMDQKIVEVDNLSAEEKMAKGSTWLTIGNMGSRLLGVIYVIPWVSMMGSDWAQANTLYGMGYNFYALFLMISTAGIPAAIGKQTAHYNSLNEYGTSRKLFHQAMKIMAIFGLACGALMWLMTPWLVKYSSGGDELVPVLHSLALAIVVIPFMSVIRGYFQGMNEMAPFAISQLLEQVARVAYMLLSTFVIMVMLNGSYTTAVTHSTLAALIGALVSIAVLLFYLRRNQVRMDVLVEHSAGEVKLNTKELMVETVKEAIPFIIIGAAITIYKLVDQGTFIRWMMDFTNYSKKQLDELYAIFNFNPDKLTMVVIGLATSMALAGLPLITEAKTVGDHKGLARLISNNLQLFSFVMMPATLGMMLLAYPLNTLFYYPNELGAGVLVEACVCGLFLGLFTLTSSMLQGLYENPAAIGYFFVGLLVKLLVQYPTVRLFEVYGPLVATMIGFGVTCGLNLYKLYKVSRFNRLLTFRRTVLILLMSLVMFVIAFIAKQIFGLFLDENSRFQSFILIMLVAGVGGASYVYMALKIHLADKLLGPTAQKIRRKLHMK